MLQRRSFFKSVALSFLLTSLTFFGLHAEVLAAQLILSWADNSTSEDGFNIERRSGSSTTFTRIATVGANVTSYTDGGLLDATTYCYRVQAFNTAGSSGYSNEQCATTAAATTTFSLTLNKSGAGTGTVTSAPTGINCGATCSATYTSG
ncbi:MAG: fibronectin type III domain-containing protein, partial [Deltaproteobacteria bacterium]|nr:fibronectin type III domain-containing protein [Deltaproteobacteria bacterium]